LESAKIEIEIKDELVTFSHNSHCSQSSHCSLNDLIQLATREMEESRQKQEDWEVWVAGGLVADFPNFVICAVVLAEVELAASVQPDPLQRETVLS